MMRKLIYTLVVMALTAIQGSMAQTADHSVKRDLTKSQMTLRMNNNEVKYYNLDQLKTVAFEGDNTMVTTTDNTTGKMWDDCRSQKHRMGPKQKPRSTTPQERWP